MSAKLLVFGYTDGEKAVIDGKLEELGLPSTNRIQSTQGDVEVRDIIVNNINGKSVVESGDPIVLFHEISDKGVFSLMSLIKDLAVPRPIFAVITEQSITWTFSVLLRHLLSEKEAMERRNEADQRGR